MAVMSPIDFDAEYLRHKVRETYDRVARDPYDSLPLPPRSRLRQRLPRL
jgi:hypothetical protein